MSAQSHAARVTALPITPITISARNAEAMTGLSWSKVRRFARAEGVPIYRINGRKVLVDGQQFIAALKRHTARQNAAPVDDEEERAAMRAQLGLARTAS